MKQIILISLIFLFAQSCRATKQQNVYDSISTFFREIETATKKNTNLWNKDLYGAMLLINPKTKQIFANESDTAGILKLDGSIYSGILPDNVNFANTSINWSGKRWAIIKLPLPQNKKDRINLLAHELFHRAQPSLGLTFRNVDNNHLDQKEGRIFLRLELEALKKAIQSSSKAEFENHLTSALIFRKYRNSLYTGTDTTENILELNEGIAEFTGLIVSGRNKKQAIEYFVNGINTFFTNPTFIRSFAYFTTPAYGYLLYGKNKNWNKDITTTTNLTDYFIKAFNINLPNDLGKTVKNIADNYNGKTIIQEETAREEKRKRIITEYKCKFIESPHFEIRLEKMNISFDPRNIMPLEDKGTIYPNIKIIDVWGVLTVENGALLSPTWDKIIITNPTGTGEKTIAGDGWILELTNGYTIEKEESSGNYRLAKR